MAEFLTKVEKYAEANGISKVDSLTDFKLQDDGNGVYIAEWNLDIAQPTDEQLASYEDSANAQDLLDIVHNNRRKEYPSIGDQLDMIFRAGLGGDEFQAAIQAVKDAHPKPE